MATQVMIPNVTMKQLYRWYEYDLQRQTPILRSAFLGRVFGLLGQLAVTVNGTIYLTRHAPMDLESVEGTVLIGHELFHVVQQREMGWWSFLARYILNWRPTQIRDGRTHPLEAPAYARGEEIRQAIGDR